MKHTRLLGKLLALAATVTLFAAPAYAGPVSGQGTWQTTLQARDLDGDKVTDAFYDTVLDITWLGNANVNGSQTWANANSWAKNLSFGGYDDWRLPTMVDTDTLGCNYSNAGDTDCGYNVQTATSEMAHLFYVSLGNKAYYTPGAGSSNQPGWGLTNNGDFLNMHAGNYWSGLEHVPNANIAWYFSTYSGYQTVGGKVNNLYAMAVRPGDVLAATVPEPGTLVLAVAALAGLGLVRRRAVGASGL